MGNWLTLSQLESEGPHQILPGWDGRVKDKKIRLAKLDFWKSASGVTLSLSLCAVLFTGLLNHFQWWSMVQSIIHPFGPSLLVSGTVLFKSYPLCSEDMHYSLE
jgi:hypothetical protein